MTYQASLTYSKPLLRKAVLAYWRKSVGAGFLVALLIIACSLAALLYEGNTSWVVGALGVSLIIGIAFPLLIYIVHFQNAMRKLHDMGEPNAVFSAEEASFTVTSGIGTTTLAWSTVSEVWRFKTFWLVLFSKAQFITLPLAGIPSEMQAYVVRRIEASGGKVGA